VFRIRRAGNLHQAYGEAFGQLVSASERFFCILK
jgi:hypothetical protein